MIITLGDYLGDQVERFPLEMTPEIERNALITVECINKLMAIARTAGVRFEIHPRTRTVLSSGLRLPSYNATVGTAAARSKHMRGQAGDLYDPEGEIDDWLMTEDGQKTLVDVGLWMEHPSATKGWSHVQTVPPGSKRRVFYP